MLQDDVDERMHVNEWITCVIVRSLTHAHPSLFPPSCQIPKLLLHRLFPKAKYSIWLDGKLRLMQDPHSLLERWVVGWVAGWIFLNFAMSSLSTSPSPPLRSLAARRAEWAIGDCFRSPGPIQFSGVGGSQANATLALELNGGAPVCIR